MSLKQFARSIVCGLSAGKVASIEDLPYWTSPPIQFVYESTATLNAGLYQWTDLPSVLTPNRPIQNNALYYFRSITLTADIAEMDFEANILTSPEFFTFLQSDARAVLFREPLIMNKYYQQFDYRLTWISRQSDNQLFAAFSGTLVQGPALVGVNSITLKAVISAQEIIDDNYIKLFQAKYPYLDAAIMQQRYSPA